MYIVSTAPSVSVKLPSMLEPSYLMVSLYIAYKVISTSLSYGKLIASPLPSILSYQPQKYNAPLEAAGA